MFIHFKEAQLFRNINTHVGIRNIQSHVIPNPNHCMLKNLNRSFVLMNENRTVYLAGLKNWPHTTESHIWHCSTRPIKLKAKVRVTLKSR